MRPRGPWRELPPHDDDFVAPSQVTEPHHWALFALAAVRRRKLVTAAVLLLGIGAVTAYYAWKPPTYRVEARILAQRQQAMPSAVRSAFEDVPTQSAWEIIHRRENLIALIRAVHLVDEATPPPAHERGVLDWLLSRLGKRGDPEPEDPVDAWVTILDSKLVVTVQDGTIEIAIELRNAQLAYDIVQAAVQNFLEARHLQEVTAIDEVMSVLRGRAAALKQDLDAVVQDTRRRVVATPPRAVAPSRQPSVDLVRVQSLLTAKQRAIQDVEEFRRRRLADLQAQLDQARNTLSDRHPTVIGLRKDIEALSGGSPQIEALREEERKLNKEYAERVAREGVRVAPLEANAQIAAEPLAHAEEDPRVRQARLNYEQAVERVNAAQTELDAARAAFKYRYSVVWPPQVPREPSSPNPRKVFSLGLLASLALALAAAVAPELLAGRIHQRWQVERILGIEVLGEIDRRH